MFHRLACCLAALLSLSLTGFASAQERVTFKPDFKVGQDMLFPLAMRQTVANEIQDQGVDEWALVCSATLVIRIESVESDGSIKASGSFKRGALRLTEADLRTGYAWGSDARDDPDWGETASLSAPLVGAKFNISVDPKGKATITGGLEAFMARHAEIGAGDERLLGFFSPQRLGEAITPIFTLDNISREPITAGKAWQTTELVTIPGAGEVRIAVDLVLDNVQPHEAEYVGNPRMSFTPRADRTSDDPVVTFLEGGGGVKGVFDLHSRMLSVRKQTTQIRTQWRTPDATIIQTQNTIMYLQLGEAKR